MIKLVSSVDIVILSNAPGEVTTWVRPVVGYLRQELGNDVSQVRISVVLSPCPHSTGRENAIALSYPEVDRVLAAEDFFSFLFWGKTKDNWDWRKQGIVIFLGGDQFYTLAIGKRLGYSTLIYAEWDARWYRWIERFAAMNQSVLNRIPSRYHHKFSVVGDLMADLTLEVNSSKDYSCRHPFEPASDTPLIGLLVGSKPAKLSQGVPLCMAIAEKIQQQKPQAKFIIPVAPTLDLATLSKYANPEHNSLVSCWGNISGELVIPDSVEETPSLVTSGGTIIELITQFPAYETLIKCQLCLTTVGANTAELASLAIPMIVLLPTQQLDAMRSWDGLPGILANVPGIGKFFAQLINWFIIKQGRLFAWPNIWAKTEIVPELVGKLEADTVADLVLDYLAHTEKLQLMSDRLIEVRGKAGAGKEIANLVRQELS
jgi:lipid A disaccharide synthetase